MNLCFALAFAAFVAPSALAESHDRLAEVAITRPISKSALIGDASPYVPPALHDPGYSHSGLYRRGDSPRLIKLVEDADESSMKDAEFALNYELVGLLTAEVVGGPRIYHAGLFEDNRRWGYYVEMELLFPGEPLTLTYKGTHGGLSKPPLALAMKNRIHDLVDLIAAAFDQRICMLDVDFIVSPHGVRWFDTEMWWCSPDWLNAVESVVGGIIAWADKMHVGYGDMLYHQLAQKVEDSRVLREDEQHAVLRSLSNARHRCANRLDR